MVGTVLDALTPLQAALATLLDAPALLTLGHAVGSHWRARLLDPVTTIPLVLLHMLPGTTAWSHRPPLAVRRWTAAALCPARARGPLGVWQQWLRRTAAVCEQTPHDEGRGRGPRTCLVDGTGGSRPDTPALHEACGPPGGQRPGCGFPVAHLLALLQAGTGFLREVLAAPGHTHERAQVACLHPALCPAAGLVGERACCSCAPLAFLRQQGLHAVLRVPQRHMGDCTPSRPPTTPQPRAAQQGLARSRWLRQLGVMDPRVAWVKPVRPPVPPQRG